MSFGVTVRLEGLSAGVLARQQARVRAATLENEREVLALASDICPRDTGYMVEHLHAEELEDGEGWEMYWTPTDFIGTTLPDGGPRPYYPPDVVLGTPRRAGRDPLGGALEVLHASVAERWGAALSPR